ncbi:MAG: hypothetical protein RMK57_06375 [Bryobacterales bacterium]|nr:hypothetical protein [Bryobacteraceae bacterium]MDW8354140.1 hypothetical protein [Bryobacterales bacterium]
MPNQGQRRRLTSWKEIAQYLGADERTVRRWERERGLPVHRLPGGKRSYVYAYPAELDQWLRSQAPETNAPIDAAAEPARPSPTERWLKRLHINARKIILTLVALLVIAIGVNWYWRLRPAFPSRAEIDGRVLEVRDRSNGLLWSHTFPDSLRTAEELQGNLLRPHRRLHLADLDGDGASEVIFRAAYRSEEGSSGPDLEEITCFSSRGKLLWRYRPQVTVNMGGMRFDGPWRFTDLIPVRTGHGTQLWASLVHQYWRPSFVVRLDASGRAALHFLNAGFIYVLDHKRHLEAHYLLAGGINNEYASAFLAVLRVDGEPACSPQTQGSRFDCTDAPKGLPERYFLFPPTELSRAILPYNSVRHIDALGAKRVVVTEETEDGAWAMYDFAENLEPDSVAFNYRFGSVHRRLEQEGLLKHPIEDCPELVRPLKIRRWDSKSGWTTMAVPPKTGLRPDVWPKN